MLIEKKIVIKALENEPLSFGHFFNNPNNEKNCEVCAVGAVIRKTLGKNINKFDVSHLKEYCIFVTRNMFLGQNVKCLLKEKNYLGALSCYFEAHDSDGYNLPAVVDSVLRKKLVSFVKKNFPTRFKVLDIKNTRSSFGI